MLPSAITGSLEVGRSVSDPWNVAKAPLVIIGQRCKAPSRKVLWGLQKDQALSVGCCSPESPCAPLNRGDAGLYAWAG